MGLEVSLGLLPLLQGVGGDGLLGLQLRSLFGGVILLHLLLGLGVLDAVEIVLLLLLDVLDDVVERRLQVCGGVREKLSLVGNLEARGDGEKAEQGNSSELHCSMETLWLID